jgi:hypothetical protein
MSRQLGLHHTNTRNRTHAGHPIFTQSARSSTALYPFSPSDITDELCQFVTAWTSPDTDRSLALHEGACLPQAFDKARGSLAGQSTLEIRAPIVLLGNASGIAGFVEASSDPGRLVSN